MNCASKVITPTTATTSAATVKSKSDLTIINDGIKKQMESIRGQFPNQEALLIPLLHAIQQVYGMVSMPAMKEAAIYLDLPLSRVREVVTFYTLFNQETVGKLHIQMCTNIACWANGAEALLASLEKLLEIKCGQTTPDGLITLSRVECLAACGSAPAMQVNQTYVENLTEAKLLALIAQWKEQMRRTGTVELSGCCEQQSRPKTGEHE